MILIFWHCVKAVVRSSCKGRVLCVEFAQVGWLVFGVLRLGRQLRPLWVVSMRRRMRIQISPGLCPTLMIEETSLVLYRARSKAPIHGTAAYSPHPKGLGWKYRVLPKDTPKWFSGSRRIRTRDPSIPSQSRYPLSHPGSSCIGYLENISSIGTEDKTDIQRTYLV